MSQNQEIDDTVQEIGENPSVNVAFVVSEHGKLESLFPEKNTKQVGQWVLVLMPFLLKLLGVEGFRFSKVQYQQGEMWIWALGRARLLLVITRPEVDTKALLHQILSLVQRITGTGGEEGETYLDPQMQTLLYEASDHLKKHARSEEGFFGSMRSLSFLYFGTLGEEWADQSLESLWMTLPILQRKPMEAMVGDLKKKISHPIKRLAFERDALSLVTRFSAD